MQYKLTLSINRLFLSIPKQTVIELLKDRISVLCRDAQQCDFLDSMRNAQQLMFSDYVRHTAVRFYSD